MNSEISLFSSDQQVSLAKDNHFKYLQRNGNAQNDLRILNITSNFDYLIWGNRCEPKKALNQMKNKPLRFFLELL